MANDSFALTRTGEDDDPTASSLIGTQAKMKGDAHIYFFTTAPPLACFHDVGSRGPRGLRHRAIDGAPITGPFNHQRPTGWVMNFGATARAAGIDEATLRVAFADAHYLPRVVELDRVQPEFTRTVWDYLDSAVSPQRVALGRDKLLQFRVEADAAAARYGVPPNIESPSGAWRATTAATTATSRPSTRWRRWASRGDARTGRAAGCSRH